MAAIFPTIFDFWNNKISYKIFLFRRFEDLEIIFPREFPEKKNF